MDQENPKSGPCCNVMSLMFLLMHFSICVAVSAYVVVDVVCFCYDFTVLGQDAAVKSLSAALQRCSADGANQAIPHVLCVLCVCVCWCLYCVVWLRVVAYNSDVWSLMQEATTQMNRNV